MLKFRVKMKESKESNEDGGDTDSREDTILDTNLDTPEDIDPCSCPCHADHSMTDTSNHESQEIYEKPLDIKMLSRLNTMNNWQESWNPRASMSFTHTKGLSNAPGDNNCFLNSAVQVLWHLDVFRRNFRTLTTHACMGNSCIFCALKVIFTQFQYSDQSTLPPDALRRALAKTFAGQQRFQLGLMDDAAECFENILMRIHTHITDRESEDSCQAPHCIPHQKFAMTLVEQIVCDCGATSEPLPFSQMVHYVSTSALASQYQKLTAQSGGHHNIDNVFGDLLRNASSQGDLRNCPSNCGRRVRIRRNLTNTPDVVSIGLIWDSDRPCLKYIKDVVNAVGTTLRLSDLFDSSVEDRWGGNKTLHLEGVVCYYGKHYSTFFFHSKMRKWILFDDANVKEMGSHWWSVVDKCCRGHYQPLLLLYTNPNAPPINYDSAMPKTVMLPGYSFGNEGASPEQQPQRGNHSRTSSSSMSGDRTLKMGGKSNTIYETNVSESGTLRRSQTPDPDHVYNRDVSSNNIGQGHQRSRTPDWGHYNSDDDLSGKNPKTNAVHFRQSSYLTAMDGSGMPNNRSDSKSSLNDGTQSYNVNGFDYDYRLSEKKQPLYGGKAAEQRRSESEQWDYVDRGGDNVVYSTGPQYNTHNRHSAQNGYNTQQGSGPAKSQYASNTYPNHGQNTDLLASLPYEANEKAALENKYKPQESDNYTISGYGQYRRQGVNLNSNNNPDMHTIKPNKVYPNLNKTIAKSTEVDRSDSCKRTVVGADYVRQPEAPHPHMPKSNTDTDLQHLNKTSTNTYRKGLPHANSANAISDSYNLKRAQSVENTDKLVPCESSNSSVSTRGRPQSARPFDYPNGRPFVESHQNNRQYNDSSKNQTDSKPVERRKSSVSDWIDHDEDQSNTYISSKAVEKLFGYQKVSATRHSKPVEQPLAQQATVPAGNPDVYRTQQTVVKDSLKVDIPDNVSLGSHKDSGYRSGSSGGDRNSASSTASSMDSPSLDKRYLSYNKYNNSAFPGYNRLNPAANANTQASGNHKLTEPSYAQVKSLNPGVARTADPGYAPVGSAGSGNQAGTNNQQTYTPTKPTQSYNQVPGKRLSGTGSVENLTQSKPVSAIVKQLEHDSSNKTVNTPSKSREKPQPPIRTNSLSTPGSECEQLVMQAEGFMEHSTKSEQNGDLHMALVQCNQAIAGLSKAMSIQDCGKDTKVHIRMKHSSCVMKSRSLHKKIMSRQESNGSSVSNDYNNDDKHSVSSQSTDVESNTSASSIQQHKSYPPNQSQYQSNNSQQYPLEYRGNNQQNPDNRGQQYNADGRVNIQSHLADNRGNNQTYSTDTRRHSDNSGNGPSRGGSQGFGASNQGYPQNQQYQQQAYQQDTRTYSSHSSAQAQRNSQYQSQQPNQTSQQPSHTAPGSIDKHPTRQSDIYAANQKQFDGLSKQANTSPYGDYMLPKPNWQATRTFTSDYVSREDYFARHPPPANRNIPPKQNIPKSNTDPHLSNGSNFRPEVEAKPKPRPPPKPVQHSNSVDESNRGQPSAHVRESSAELYGTLPRKKGGKPQRHSTGNHQSADVYQSYLQTQRQQAQQLGQQNDDYRRQQSDDIRSRQAPVIQPVMQKEEADKKPGIVISHRREWSKDDIKDLLRKDFVGKRDDGQKSTHITQGQALNGRAQAAVAPPTTNLVANQMKKLSCSNESVLNKECPEPVIRHIANKGNLTYGYPQQHGPSTTLTRRKSTVGTKPEEPPTAAQPNTYHSKPNCVDKPVVHNSWQPVSQTSQAVYGKQAQLLQQQSSWLKAHQDAYNAALNGVPQQHELRKSASQGQMAGPDTWAPQNSNTVNTGTMDQGSEANDVETITIKQPSTPQPIKKKFDSKQPITFQTFRPPDPPDPPLPSEHDLPDPPPNFPDPPMDLPEPPAEFPAPPTEHELLNAQFPDPSPSIPNNNFKSELTSHLQNVISKQTEISEPSREVEIKISPASRLSRSCSPSPKHKAKPKTKHKRSDLPRHQLDNLSTLSGFSGSSSTSGTSGTSASTTSSSSRKSALVKVRKNRKKRKERRVTFNDNVCLIACKEETEEEKIDYMDYVAKLTHSSKARQVMAPSSGEESDSNTPVKTDSSKTVQVEIIPKDENKDGEVHSSAEDSDNDSCDKVKCSLCRKKCVEVTEIYCQACSYYMSQFQPQES